MLIIEGTGTKYKFPDDIEKYNTNKVFKGHPMLFFSGDDIANYRRKATGTHKGQALRLRRCADSLMINKNLPPVTYDEFGSTWNEEYGNALPALAMNYILQPNNLTLLDFITLYMDRMASYKSWYVIGLEKDEVPIGHSLMGFVTAFDMLYNDLNDQRKHFYLEKIRDVTKLMYDLSTKRWWGWSFIQNHVATNVVALFSSSLVLRNHVPESVEWLKHSLTLLDRNFHLLNGISDGSLSEGVTYGSYASR